MKTAVLVTIVGLIVSTFGTQPLRVDGHPDRVNGLETSAALINEVCWWQSCRIANWTNPNESLARPTGPWIELFNRSAAALPLNGSRLLDANGGTIAQLPAWTLPAGAYLVVTLGRGVDDADFADGRGLFFAGMPLVDEPAPDGDSGAALWVDGQDALIDAVIWSALGDSVGGAGVDDAVDAAHWPAGDVFPFADHYTMLLSAVVLDGTSFGRSADADDTNTSDDWMAAGGRDAVGPTPGGRNIDPDIVLEQERKRMGAAGSAKGDRDIPPDPGPRVWTVMFYVDGREAKLGAAWKKTLKKISQTEYSSRVAFVAQMTDEQGADNDADEAANDRTRRWAFFDGFVFNRARHEVDIGGGETTNPGDPAALAAFINWAKATYPARKYAIVMVGHGQGWKGTNITDDAQDLLIMSELEQGLRALGRPFDTLIFESCLMGTVEVAHQLAGEVTNLVASQEVMWMNIMPWADLARFIRDDEQADGMELATRALSSYRKGALATETKAAKISRKYTISHVLPSKVASDLFPAIQTFAQALETDVEEIRERDRWDDNLQVTIFERVLRPSEKFFDGSYRDLGHVAELASMQPSLSAAAPAAIVKEKMMRRSGVILRSHRGTFHPKATGLSIYFPHAQTQPNFEREQRASACAHLEEHCGELPVFDRPWHCPHLYARDPDFRLPRLQTDGSHTMVEDAEFHFTADGGWDEFLHRFYKPVADACIRTAGGCVKSVSVAVGETVTLSGHGSSDIDTDAVGDPNQVDHQPHTWHWDLDINRDSPARVRDYRYDVMYPCAQEDCDRNDADDLDDDPDAAGELVAFTCAAPGTFEIKLWTWDDHNGHPKLFREDDDHNSGKHWLHFNIDDDPVSVSCVDRPTEPTKRADRAQVQPGENLEYEILLPPAGGSGEGLEPASIIDALPAEVNFVEGSLSCPELGVCFYDGQAHQVVWEGEIDAEQTARLVFVVELRNDVPCVPSDPTLPPPEVVNDATTQRNGVPAIARSTTPIECPVAARQE